MLYSVSLVVLVCITASTQGDNAPPIVQLPMGKIEGSIGESLKGRPYYKFEGIPYAIPPVGPNRFKAPQPIEDPWENTWQAKTNYKCMQYNQYTEPGDDPIIGDEDCLYLSVYTPQLGPEAHMGVVVYIHGGAFMFTHGGKLGPQILMDKNLVLVKINYRLGPLGFLSTEDDVVPGNNGLKDQTLALKWVRENIYLFGGENESVTLMGMSAGGASVHLHYMMPQSQGLFANGLSQSGCALNPWVLMENALEKTRKVASTVGCPSNDSHKIVNCLKQRPARQIVATVKEFQPWLYNPFSPFGVVVDSWAKDPVLAQHPLTLLREKKLPQLSWMVSFTGSEGLYPASDFYADEDYLRTIDNRWNELMPFILDYNYTVDPTKQEEISQKIRQYYLQDRHVNKTTFMDFVKILSDRLFLVDIEKAAVLHASAVPVPIRAYYFTYRGTHSQSEYRSKSTDNLGASHGDDTSYILKVDLDMLASENDRRISEIMTDILFGYSNFGALSAPVEWPYMTESSPNFTYLKIAGPRNLTVEVKGNIGNNDFWRLLPIKENEKLVDGKI